MFFFALTLEDAPEVFALSLKIFLKNIDSSPSPSPLSVSPSVVVVVVVVVDH